ncbi:LysE family translocator [Maridesulfovibrio bastinii]|uniref:LysE family translocator n=1 Tax=Maridesulfovibrio bastinii TaxID=47157 RepID=UPI0003FD1870|nr:LysE family translocator [Maridesulfovibrio bastinii]
MDALTLSFIPIAAILTITPGPDTMLVVNSTLTRSTSAGLATVAGINSGLLVHAIASATGLSLILMKSATAFEIVKIAGALYIIWLGIKSLIKGFNKHDAIEEAQAGLNTVTPASRTSSFKEGFLTNVLNPKVAVFYLALLPQFILPGENIFTKSLLLMTIHFSLGIIWFSSVVFALGKMRSLISCSSFKKNLQKISGAVFIYLGFKMASEQV